MNRYDWILWAFRLLFSSEVIDNVKVMVSRLEANESKDGATKRDFVEEAVKPMVGNVSVYFLRALIEVALGTLRAKT